MQGCEERPQDAGGRLPPSPEGTEGFQDTMPGVYMPATKVFLRTNAHRNLPGTHLPSNSPHPYEVPGLDFGPSTLVSIWREHWHQAYLTPVSLLPCPW